MMIMQHFIQSVRTRNVINEMLNKETSGYAKGGIVSAAGKKYMPNPLGTPCDDVWDIPIINPMSNERVGYPTQKPLALLKRIISALSNEGDLVGDFCFGSGTTLVAAKMLNRHYFGCDISPAAVETAKSRLSEQICEETQTKQNQEFTQQTLPFND